MRRIFLSLFVAAGLLAYPGCDDMDTTLDPTTEPAPPVVEPTPPVVEPTPPSEPVPPATDPTPPTDPTTGDLGTQPGDVPGARAGDPNVTAPSTAEQDPTNTGLNERDAVDSPPPLPTDQEATGAGMELTAKIRSEITSTEGMSINARNVKIVTEGNTVTLRGPVQSEDEKQTIDRIAREAAGENYTVVNMLDVQQER